MASIGRHVQESAVIQPLKSHSDEENNSTDDEKVDEIYGSVGAGMISIGIQKLYQEVHEGLEKKSTCKSNLHIFLMFVLVLP